MYLIFSTCLPSIYSNFYQLVQVAVSRNCDRVIDSRQRQLLLHVSMEGPAASVAEKQSSDALASACVDFNRANEHSGIHIFHA